MKHSALPVYSICEYKRRECEDIHAFKYIFYFFFQNYNNAVEMNHIFFTASISI